MCYYLCVVKQTNLNQSKWRPAIGKQWWSPLPTYGSLSHLTILHRSRQNKSSRFSDTNSNSFSRRHKIHQKSFHFISSYLVHTSATKRNTFSLLLSFPPTSQTLFIPAQSPTHILSKNWAQKYEQERFTHSCTLYSRSLSITLTSENTHLLCKGKYHCMTDPLFDWLGFGQTSKSVCSFNSTKQLNPNQSNRRSAVQWYFPLRSKWVFSAYIHGDQMLEWKVAQFCKHTQNVALFKA